MNLKVLKISAVAASMSILAGCATSGAQAPVETRLPNSAALDELAVVSIEARDELRLLAKTQEAMAQKAMTKEQHEQRFIQATTVAEGFEKKGTFKFTGKAHKAAKALAMVTGYKFVLDGKPPSTEPWVHINIVDEPLHEALKELGLQTGDSVSVQLHAKVMRVVYK